MIKNKPQFRSIPRVTEIGALTRRQIRIIFKRHRGQAALLARELKVKQTNISEWFRGKLTSERVERAIRRRAAELLKEELSVLAETAGRLARLSHFAEFCRLRRTIFGLFATATI